MKKIEAIIRNDKLSFIKKALTDNGIAALTTFEVKGRGKQSEIIQVFDGTKIYADLLPKTKIEIVTKDEDVERVIDIIVGNARTGNIGDGKIFITSVEEVIRIRDGAKGKDIA